MSKKLIFISTHSTEFVHLQSVDELASIVFCSDIYEDVVQIDPSIDEFRSRKIQALLSRMGQEHKLALFSKRPLLVEGPSDQIICSSLSVKLDLNTEAAGSQILPVTGKGQMPTVVKLMRLVGKTPSVLVDADGLADGLDLITSFTNTDEAAVVATEMGHKNATEFARGVYNDFAQLVASNWEDISDLAIQHTYWANRDTDHDDLKVKRRAAFSTLLNLEDTTVLGLDNSTLWTEIRTRLISLLKLLGSVGCFVLTKGTIENYYIYTENIPSDEKPNTAAYEASNFSDADNNDLKKTYADIVEAIAFAAQAQEINEGAAIREALLAVVSPVLATLTTETTTQQLSVKSKGLLGNKADLFRMEVDNTNGLHLVVNLSSKILDVKGFPLKIPADANPITSVNEQMNLG